MRPFLPIGKETFSYRGAYMVPLFNLSVCVRMCNIRRFFCDCESCTRPISTNPGTMEAGEYGLTHGTCFDARRLQVVAVAGLLWISWCVWVGRIFACYYYYYFSLRTHTACSKYEAPLPHLPLYYNSNEAVFCLQGKKAST